MNYTQRDIYANICACIIIKNIYIHNLKKEKERKRDMDKWIGYACPRINTI